MGGECTRFGGLIRAAQAPADPECLLGARTVDKNGAGGKEVKLASLHIHKQGQTLDLGCCSDMPAWNEATTETPAASCRISRSSPCTGMSPHAAPAVAIVALLMLPCGAEKFYSHPGTIEPVSLSGEAGLWDRALRHWQRPHAGHMHGCRHAACSSHGSGSGDRPVQEGVARLERPADLGAAHCQVARPADALRILAVEQHQALPCVPHVDHHPLPLPTLAAAACCCCRRRAGGAASALLQAGGPWPARVWCSRDRLPPRLSIHLHVRVAELALDL